MGPPKSIGHAVVLVGYTQASWKIKNNEGRYLGQRDNFGDIRERRGAEGGWAGGNKFAYTLSGNPHNDALWEIGGTDTISMIHYHSGRYIFDVGSKPARDEGGWNNAPRVKMIDDNYYKRWSWEKISQGGGYYLIQNTETKRYLFASGETVYTTDGNYYNMALWTFEKVQ